jgi:hypothetical protein
LLNDEQFRKAAEGGPELGKRLHDEFDAAKVVED